MYDWFEPFIACQSSPVDTHIIDDIRPTETPMWSNNVRLSNSHHTQGFTFEYMILLVRTAQIRISSTSNTIRRGCWSLV